MTRDAMNQEQDKDNALAAYTDALLAGNLDCMPDQRAVDSVEPELADTVALLARTVGKSQPPEALRRRTRQWVASNWRREKRVGGRLKEILRVFRFRPVVALGTLSALGLIVVLLAVLIPSGVSQTSGTVVGDTRWVGLALVLAGVVGAAVYLAIRNRRN